MHNFLRMAASRRAALMMMASACLLGSAGAHAKSASQKATAYAGTLTGNLNAGSNNTIYVLFDPLCGACRRLYQRSLQQDYAHLAFKWLPVNVLRPGARTEQMAASVLVGGAAGRANLEKVMAGGVPQVTVTQKMRNELRQNEAFLKALHGGSGSMSVPTIVNADGSRLR